MLNFVPGKNLGRDSERRAESAWLRNSLEASLRPQSVRRVSSNLNILYNMLQECDVWAWGHCIRFYLQRPLDYRFGNETLGDEVKVGLTYTKENGSRDDTNMTPAKCWVSFDPLLSLNATVLQLTTLQLMSLKFDSTCTLIVGVISSSTDLNVYDQVSFLKWDVVQRQIWVTLSFTEMLIFTPIDDSVLLLRAWVLFRKFNCV